MSDYIDRKALLNKLQNIEIYVEIDGTKSENDTCLVQCVKNVLLPIIREFPAADCRLLRDKKAMTNGDKIRQMSDEELATFLSFKTLWEITPKWNWLDWLKQERLRQETYDEAKPM